ncbi:MAG: helicase C-terminal domain-containing protein [bacterium]
MTITDFFSQKGPLSKAFSDYEIRTGQIKLSQRIAKVMRDGGVGMYEAGTGIGKSLAYLLPAYAKSKTTNKPVIISTTTNNLLSQLLNKDLPMLRDVLESMGETLTYTGIKGKSHYACLAKMDGNIESSISDLIKDIEKTKNGERSELENRVKDEDWRKISYNREDCAGTKCPFFKDCYIANIKKRAEKVNIIVTNHNIIFAERLAKFQILPDYDDLIFDEGHNIESVATDYLTQSLSLSLLTALSKDIFISDGRSKSGLANFAKLVNYSDDLISISIQIINIRNELDDYINSIANIYKTSSFNEDNSRDNGSEFIIEDRAEFVIKLEPLKKELQRLFEILDGIELPGPNQTLALNAVVNTIITLLNWIANIQDPEILLWGKRKDDDIFIHQTPLKIGELLKKEIYQKLNSTIILSATLTVNENFGFMKSRLGLNNMKSFQIKTDRDENYEGDNISDEFVDNVVEEVKDVNIDTGVFESPFDYEEQMQVVIRDEIPDHKSYGYLSQLTDAILEGIQHTNGNAFVLFTSYGIMNDVADSIWRALEHDNIPLLVQESGNREEIVKKFREGNSVLFGVESFWEGVDIPGDALTHVIIVKLPFKVPSTPIEKARAELVEKEGGNSFYDLSLPQAVIKFRQGIGRLIRTQSDKGIVTILDPRIVKSSYGKFFKQYLGK